MDRKLNEVEVRILGCLIEKELTTPDNYPLSLNALTNACNQKSNRNPIVSYDEETVRQGIKSLQADGLIVIVSGAGQRVRKYRHRFPDIFFVTKKEMVILCTLMLRGAQTVGEIRTHTGRMHDFENLEEVGESLNELIKERQEPLVIMLPRQPGTKENRYMHLLAGQPEVSETATESTNLGSHATAGQTAERMEQLEKEVENLRQELEELKQSFQEFKSQFGE